MVFGTVSTDIMETQKSQSAALAVSKNGPHTQRKKFFTWLHKLTPYRFSSESLQASAKAGIQLGWPFTVHRPGCVSPAA